MMQVPTTFFLTATCGRRSRHAMTHWFSARFSGARGPTLGPPQQEDTTMLATKKIPWRKKDETWDF